MTPDERNLLNQFLSDLSQARGVAKDPEAAQMIDQAVRANPDAAYVLTQHALITDQALHQAKAQIEQLQAALSQAQAQGQGASSSFFGGARPAQPASSPWAQAAQPPPQYAPQAPPQYPPQQGGGLFGGGPVGPGPLGGQQSGLGSFLRSAGTTAAGVAGGAFLFEGLSNIFGGGHHGFGGGGFGGGGGWGGGPVEENVTINNYGDDDRGFDDYDPGTSGDIGGDDYS